MAHFGTTAATGDAADDADPDHDGLTNFTEFAFGLSPADRGSNSLPSFVHTGTSFTATFTGATPEVIYSAAQSATMQPGTWTEITDTGVAGEHVFSVPAGAAKVFVRFAVRLR